MRIDSRTEALSPTLSFREAGGTHTREKGSNMRIRNQTRNCGCQPMGRTAIIILFGMIASATLIHAEEKKPQSQKPAAKKKAEAPQPKLDKILDQLAKIDPKVLADRLASIQSRIKKINQENTALQNKLKKNQDELTRLKAQVQLLDAWVRARPKVMPKAPPPKPKPKPKPKPPAKPKAVAKAAPKPKPKPKMKPPAKPAPPTPPAPRPTPAKPAPQKTAPSKPAVKNKASVSVGKTAINFADHILPIFRIKCFSCHNPDKAKGGLVLVSHEELMLGGSSGDVIQPGAPEQSRLYRLINHLEKPHMPAKQPKLEDAQLDLIRRWIMSGAPPNTDSTLKATTAAKPPPPSSAPPAPPRFKQGLRPLPAVALAVHPSTPMIAVGGNEQIILYDAEALKPKAVLDFPEGRIEQIAYSADGLLLIAAGGRAGESGTLVAYDTESMQRTGQFDRLYDSALAAAISPDGGFIAVGGSNRRVRVFDSFDGSRLFEITAHNEWIRATAFSPDGLLLATADRAGGLFVWESDTGREVHALRGHTSGVTAVAFRADSLVLASCGDDGIIRLWEMENGRQIRQWNAHAGAVLDLAFATDGRIATCGADGFARLWQQDGKKVRDYPKQDDWLYSIALTPDATRLLTGRWNGDITVFETATGKRVGKLTTAPKPEPPPSVAMSGNPPRS